MKPPNRDNKAKPQAQEPFSGQLLSAPTTTPAPYAYWIALAVITLAGVVLRAAWLGHFMRYDESYQYIQFASAKEGILFYYQTPNNHVLHTMFVRLFTAIAGDSPQVIRLPAFLAGVAVMPLAAALARRISGRWEAGLFAAALAAASSILIEYSANARGYSMVCAATLAMALFTARLLADVRSWRTWACWIAAGALGLFTIPVMAYPILLLSLVIIGQALWSHKEVAVRRWVIERVLAAGVLLILAAAVLYLPVAWATGDQMAKARGRDSMASLFEGYQSLWGNRFVAPVAMDASAVQLGAALADTARDWTRDAGALWLVLLAGLAAAAATAVRTRTVWGLVPIAGPPLLVLAALVQSASVFPRVWLFLLPLLLAVAATGLVQLADLAHRRVKPAYALAALGLLAAAACGASAWQTQRESCLISEDQNTFVDVEIISKDLASAADGATAVVADEVGTAPLAYYGGRAGTTFLRADSPQCLRLLTVARTDEDPMTIRERIPGLGNLFGPATPWKAYPHATVYVSVRLANGGGNFKNLPAGAGPSGRTP